MHRLRLLRELKHRGTLAAVASALSYSPSAISQQLALLETEAGVRLLEPVGRRVRLTAQAEILVAHTEALLQRLEQAEADLAASLPDVGGTVRLAAFQSAALALAPAVLSGLAEAHPSLRVEVAVMEPEESLPALVARRFDVVIGEEYPGHPARRAPELHMEDLMNDPLRLAAPGAGQRKAFTHFADRAWVMEPEGTAARRWADALCREAGFEPDVRYTSSDLLLHVRLVRGGHAVALLPDLATRDDPDQAGALLPLPSAPARRVFTAVRRGAGGHPAVAAVRAALGEAVGRRGAGAVAKTIDGRRSWRTDPTRR